MKEPKVPTLGARWPEVSLPRPASPGAKELAPQCSGIQALRAGDARGSCCLGAPGCGAWRLYEPAAGAQSRPGAYLWVPPQLGAPSPPKLWDILALRHQGASLHRAAKAAPRSVRHPRTGSWQPLSCATKGTLPSIAATADARRSSSRQSRAIAGQRPPDGARAETRRVPGRRCAPGGWLLRVLSRSGRDRTPRSAAWAWAGVYARGAVRARVDVGVHVCVCVYGRGGCVRACVREDEGERAWESARERVRPGVTLRATAEPTGGQSGPD